MNVQEQPQPPRRRKPPKDPGTSQPGDEGTLKVRLSELGFELPRRAHKAPVQNARSGGHKKDEPGQRPAPLQEMHMKVVTTQASEPETSTPATAPEPAPQASPTQAPPVPDPIGTLLSGMVKPLLGELSSYNKNSQETMRATVQVAQETANLVAATHVANEAAERAAAAAERAAAAADTEAEAAHRTARAVENVAAQLARNSIDEERAIPTWNQVKRGAKKAGFWAGVLGLAGAATVAVHAAVNRRGIFAAKPKAPAPTAVPVLPTLP